MINDNFNNNLSNHGLKQAKTGTKHWLVLEVGDSSTIEPYYVVGQHPIISNSLVALHAINQSFRVFDKGFFAKNSSTSHLGALSIQRTRLVSFLNAMIEKNKKEEHDQDN